MKKVMTVALILGAMYTTANAMEVRPYFGVEASYSLTKFDNNFLNDEWSLDEDKNNNFNVGLNAGLQFDINENFYFGGEIYVNTGKIIDEKNSQINIYDPIFAFNESWSDKIELHQFFGFRVNAGYNFNEKISVFGFVGLDYNKYESKYNYEDHHLGDYFHGSYDDNFVSPSFGLGIAYNFTKNLQVNLSYQLSIFTIEDNILPIYQNFCGEDIDRDIDITANTFKIGFKYLF